MTRLRDLSIRRVYGPTRGHDALREFLIPALSSAVSYDRVAGYFSSGSLAYTAPGISKLANRGGQIRMVTSHQLVDADFNLLSDIDGDPEKLNLVAEEFEAAANYPDSSLEGRMRSDYLKAMCWLLRSGQLEIKFVVPNSPSETSLEKFHSKFGIIRDETGDEIVFSGSTNETALGWSGNLENIDTKPLWVEGFREFADYKDTFEDLWTGHNLPGWQTVELPHALRRRLVKLAPEGDFPKIEGWDHPETEQSRASLARTPRDYQIEAVKAWEQANRAGILEMATGTGKTLTARLCIENAQKMGTLFTVLVTPYQHISDQWAKELSGFNTYQVGAEGNWKADLQRLQLEAELGYFENLVVIAVKNTASTSTFVQMTSSLSRAFDNSLFIGDEVHWLGASTFQAALNPVANYRLGLSATPSRYFDDAGTQVLNDYFGVGTIYKFGLQEALNWRNPETKEVGVLTPYEYHPIFVYLNEDEIASWLEYTQSIQILLADEHRSREDQEKLEGLLNSRADIAKNAASKIPALKNLLVTLGHGLNQALIYAANQTQMENAMVVAREVGIDTGARITAAEGSAPSKKFNGLSERQFILDRFAKGIHSVIFAIAALDEGVDIPSAEIGIILASSGNEKEFIQRRGRLMRRSPGKPLARIYDFVVLPPEDKFESLRSKELKRAKEFAELAVNSLEVTSYIERTLGAFNEQ